MTPGVPTSMLFDGSCRVRGAFRSLFQGDHSGVEVATEAHASLLQAHGLLEERHRLQATHPIGRSGP